MRESPYRTPRVRPYRRKVAPRVREQHSRTCPLSSGEARRCNCRPSFLASVRHRGKTRELSFATLAEAVSWSQEARDAVRRGQLPALPREETPLLKDLAVSFMHRARAGEALGRSGLALGHAMAQVLGGRYGLPHGVLNAICLPPALRFNAEYLPPAFGEALGTDDPPARVEELARLGGIGRLRDLGVASEELPDVAESIAGRPGARANPRPASPAEILKLLESAY
jgi:hypothetical protein